MSKRKTISKKVRFEVFKRDSFTCQYCGTETRKLTLDHIMPRSRGGSHVWENVVSACISCNHRKAGSTPREANMRMLREPKAPRPNPYYVFHNRSILDEWRQFIPWVS